MKEISESRLQNFILLENKLRWNFKEKFDKFLHIEKWSEKVDNASELWRQDKGVWMILKDLRKVADEINIITLK